MATKKRSEANATVDRSTVDVEIQDRAKLLEASAKKLDQQAPVDDSLADFLNVKDRSPRLSDDFEEILAITFVPTANVREEYAALESQLHIGEQRGDRATVMASLDNAEVNARRAFKLYLTARIEEARFEKERDIIRSAMTSSASRSLQQEKDSGQRSKAITDNDVKMKATELYPDEFGALEERSERVKSMVKSMEHLAETWKSRARSLQTILGAMR